ncbi:MAG: DNA gyrase inhibitor YacG [Proteobacteria bacterium]|nr:DNA gyrase inhibitor YacG [Pseudomonadota bacterium]
MKKTIKCPECGKSSEYSPANKYRPFCSKRCRLIDLGEWIEGKYRLEAEENYHTTEPQSGDANTKH